MEKVMDILDRYNNIMILIIYNMPNINLEGLMWSDLRLRERGC